MGNPKCYLPAFANSAIADLDQLVLLTVDYVCVREGIPIPWDKVMKEIAPGSTGEAIKQHIAKVRKIREDNNLVVPPKVEKTARRKIGKVGGISGMVTPPSAGRVKKVKAEEEEKDENVVTPKKVSFSLCILLWALPSTWHRNVPKLLGVGADF